MFFTVLLSKFTPISANKECYYLANISNIFNKVYTQIIYNFVGLVLTVITLLLRVSVVRQLFKAIQLQAKARFLSDKYDIWPTNSTKSNSVVFKSYMIM